MRLTYPFDLPKLPYSFDAMKPYVSEWTMESHYEKNHRGYVTKTNELISKLPQMQDRTLASVVSQSKGKLFEQSAQHFNHVFWWFSMKPPKMISIPSQTLTIAIEKDFGSFDNWKNDFLSKGLSRFGSGWVWLCKDGDRIVNTTTANAGIPNFINGITPLLVCDLWEHAYFCDYTTNRKQYITNWFNLINWQMVEVRYNGEDELLKLF